MDWHGYRHSGFHDAIANSNKQSHFGLGVVDFHAVAISRKNHHVLWEYVDELHTVGLLVGTCISVGS